MTDKKDDALKLAREALEHISSHYMSLPKIGCMALAAVDEAIAEQPAQSLPWHHPDCEGECIACLIEREVTAAYGTQGLAYLRRHLAVTQPPEQEPVAWMYQCSADSSGPVLMQHKRDWAESGSGLWTETPLYTSQPASKPWVGLTPEERQACTQSPFTSENYLAIEAKLREKNA